jgi:hypothetical protein
MGRGCAVYMRTDAYVDVNVRCFWILSCNIFGVGFALVERWGMQNSMRDKRVTLAGSFSLFMSVLDACV